MSAESHQKRAPSSSSDAVRLVPNIVPPQAVSDRSIVDSVAGFINDVALTNAPQTDPKDHILWVKFESLADISDFSLGEDWDVEGNLPPPLLLCIGYGSGVQVWAIPANGEAIEVMSWKHGAVKVLRILPTPFLSNNSELASDLLDQFIHKRPLMGLCGDCPTANQTSQHQQFHAVSFVSLKDGDVVKSIRFKSPIVDIVANRTSIAITFSERIAVFDARTLEDRLTVTTCYPCPGGLCPIALGDRWLAYAEKKLIPSKASAGGCFSDGVSSYTATVLNAAKNLGKGLRELGEHVAAGLTGNASNMAGQGGSGVGATSSPVNADGSHPGIVTILDIKHAIKDISPTSGTPVAINGNDPIIAHFLANGDAITTMSFDPSGMLLLTADRRGHDFNVFRIQPHPSGSVLAAAHHLYILHRGDTSAKVQDISFSFDSRWVAVSSMRGTTHVFPITPYGGQPGYRTHSAPHVVNRLSRFHRSAGLSVDGRSSSPILMAEHAVQSTAYTNPRLPPFPHPTVVLPLAQLRQPSSLSSASSLTSLSSPPAQLKGHLHSRQRLISEESHQSKPLRVAAVFAKARSWLLDPPGMSHETPTRLNRKPVDSLFVIAGHGALIQYDLDPKHVSSIPKDKVCDESPIELEVEAKAQWVLGSRSNSHVELSPPLPSDNWLIKDRVIDNNLNLDMSQMENERTDERDDRWLSQVEIVTHAGPHRRLWMGPQFIFKTYNTPSGSSLAHIDMESVEIGASRSARSTPMNMPLQPNPATAARPLMPVLIESGSCSSHEQSPRLMDSFHYESTDSDVVIGPDSQLREDLADAMKDCAAIPIARDSGSTSDELTNVLKTASYHSTASDGASLPHINLQTVVVSIVNPQGTVTTVTNNPTQLEESFSDDNYIHENCDETMFRPVVTVMSDPKKERPHGDEDVSQPIEMHSQLIVPVIDEKMLEQKKKEREMEQQEKARKLQEANRAKIARQEEEDRKKAEAEDRKKVEAEKAQKKAEEKLEEAPPPTYQKRGKKSQKFYKKAAEPEKKVIEPESVKLLEPEKSFVEVAKPEEKPRPFEVYKMPAEVEVTTTQVDVPDKQVEVEAPEKPIRVEAPEKPIRVEAPEKPIRVEERKKPIEVEKIEVIESKPVEAEKKLVECEKKPFEFEKKFAKYESKSAEFDRKKFYTKKKALSPPPKASPIEEIAAKSELEVTPDDLQITSDDFDEVLNEAIKKLELHEEPAKPEVEQKIEKISPLTEFVEVIKKKEKSPKPIDFPALSLPWATKVQPVLPTFAPPLPPARCVAEPTESAPEPKQPTPEPAPEIKESKVEASKVEPAAKKGKKGKKYPGKQDKAPVKVEIYEDFPPLGSPPPLDPMPIEDHRLVDSDAIMRISKHETIGDDEIEIIPHENTVVIRDSPEKISPDVEIIDEHFMLPAQASKQQFIKNEDFYDIDDDLPPLEPLESFDANFEPLCFDEQPMEKEAPVDFDEEKRNMKKKMSELLKDTNMIFAMCSSLKEMKEDDDSKSMGSSQIQRSTSSSMTTNTTTATFASASSNQTGECQDSDYKSLELDLDESAPTDLSTEVEFKVPADLKPIDDADAEDVSSFEATSSDDSSKKDSATGPKFKRDDDEELRPLLQTSITSLSSPISSSEAAATTNTTEANDTSTLPDTNQKSSPQAASNNGNGNKRKNKKKRR